VFGSPDTAHFVFPVLSFHCTVLGIPALTRHEQQLIIGPSRGFEFSVDVSLHLFKVLHNYPKFPYLKILLQTSIPKLYLVIQERYNASQKYSTGNLTEKLLPF